MLFQWFSIKCAGVALFWFGGECLLWAGLEALFGCTPVVHATSHCFCGWCPHQIWDCLQGEQHTGFFSALVTFLRFSLLQYMFRVQMRKANMLVHLCLPIWKQSRWTWKKRKSVNDRCMTSAFICSNSTVTGECPWFAKISLILNVQVNQSQPLMHTITWIMHPTDTTRSFSSFLQTLQPAAAAGSFNCHLGAPGLPFELAPVGRLAGIALQPPECLSSGPPPQ